MTGVATIVSRRAHGRDLYDCVSEFMISRDISWEAMLGEDERDATVEEITAAEAEQGPFLPADGEG